MLPSATVLDLGPLSDAKRARAMTCGDGGAGGLAATSGGLRAVVVHAADRVDRFGPNGSALNGWVRPTRERTREVSSNSQPMRSSTATAPGTFAARRAAMAAVLRRPTVPVRVTTPPLTWTCPCAGSIHKA